MNSFFITLLISILGITFTQLSSSFFENKRLRTKELKRIYAKIYAENLFKVYMIIEVVFHPNKDIEIKENTNSATLSDEVINSLKNNMNLLSSNILQVLHEIMSEEYFYYHVPTDYYVILLYNSLLDEFLWLNKKIKVINKQQLSQVFKYSLICKLFLVLQHKLWDDEIEIFLKKNDYFEIKNVNMKKIRKSQKKLSKYIKNPNDSDWRPLIRDIQNLLDIIVKDEYKKEFNEIYNFEYF